MSARHVRKEWADKVRDSFEKSPFRWRTARGVAKDVGLMVADLVSYLEDSGDFIRAQQSNNQGEALYALRKKLSKEESLARRALANILNDPE